MTKGLRPFFEASGVAIIGASSKPNKLSYGILKNLTSYGYKGAIYPVNPSATEILGLRSYPSILEVPDPIELAVIVLPAEMVLTAVKDCVKRGILAVTLISGGFKELGERGEVLENEVLAVIQSAGMRMVGPNCVGTMSLYSGLNTTFIDGVPQTGGIGFLSQSGAVLGGIVDLVKDKGIGFAHFSSLGNEADVTETDMIAYLGDDPHTKVIAAYVEQIKEGARFIQVAKKVSRKKPIVLIKAGKTSAGARAVSSHTGSLAGAHSAYQAAFRQSGVIEVQNLNDLFDVSQALALQPIPQGNRVAILTNSGGPAALASDSLSINGLRMADLSRNTQAKLRERLNPSAQVANPVDMLGGAEPVDYESAMNLVIQDSEVDIVVAILVPQSLVNPVEVARSVIRVASNTHKTVLACFIGDPTVAEPRRVLHANHVPMVVYPESIGSVLGAMWRYAQWRGSTEIEPDLFLDINRPLAAELLAGAEDQNLGEALTRPLLDSYGINIIRGDEGKTIQDCVQIAENIGFPVAVKANIRGVLHKSDIGAIRLNIKNSSDLRKAAEEMRTNIQQKMPDAQIYSYLVEKMAPQGQEVIVGMRRDSGFGPVMMFGMGGIFVELIKDVAFRIAPLTRQDAEEMIFETKAARLLQGYRGEPAADVEAVISTILRLSQLACDFPQIDEIEINPLLVLTAGEGAIALDGRVILNMANKKIKQEIE